MARRRTKLFITIIALIVAFAGGWAAYAGAAWVAFGKNTELPEERDSLIAQFMPKQDIDETHEVLVDAPASATWAALAKLDLQDSRQIRMIFRGRELLMRSSSDEKAPRQPFLDQLAALGWRELAEVPGKELVLGAVTQPWQPNVTFTGLSAARFTTFATADYVKIVVIFAVDSLGPGRSRFRTETVALATDAAARQKFRKYWAVYSPGILLIRRAALRLVKEGAEKPAVP